MSERLIPPAAAPLAAGVRPSARLDRRAESQQLEAVCRGGRRCPGRDEWRRWWPPRGLIRAGGTPDRSSSPVPIPIPIDTVLAKSDLELGIEALMRGMQP